MLEQFLSVSVIISFLAQRFQIVRYRKQTAQWLFYSFEMNYLIFEFIPYKNCWFFLSDYYASIAFSERNYCLVLFPVNKLRRSLNQFELKVVYSKMLSLQNSWRVVAFIQIKSWIKNYRWDKMHGLKITCQKWHHTYFALLGKIKVEIWNIMFTIT